MEPVRVAFVTEVLAEYKLHLHQRLARLPGYHVMVWHGPARPGTLPGDANPGNAIPHRSARNVYLPLGRLVWQRVREEVRAFAPDILVLEDGMRILSHWPLLLEARRRDVPVVLYTHGSNLLRRWMYSQPTGEFIERLRREMQRRASALVFYTRPSAEAYRRRHPESACFVSVNTLDVHAIRADVEALPPGHREEVRRRLGVPGGSLLVASVGRLIPEHDPRSLFECVRKARAAGASCHVLSVGSGPLERERQAWVDALPAAERSSYHLLPRTPLGETTSLLAACDVMVLSGTVGLALVHGFAVGLPCVASRMECQGPEADYLEDGRNGLFLPDHGPSLTEALVRLEREPALRERLAEGARRYTRAELAPERQVAGFAEAFDFVRGRGQGQHATHRRSLGA